MADPISISDKSSGGTLTAAEFNELLDALKDGTKDVNSKDVSAEDGAFSGSVTVAGSLSTANLTIPGVPNTWNPTKHASNPVIDGTAADTDQSYPPSVIKVGDNYYASVKSNGVIYGFSSTDGVTWTEEGVLLNKAGTWDASKLEYTVLRYDPDTATYHLYFTGVGTYTQAIGHATSSSPMSGYSRDATDPIYIPSDWTSDINRTGYTADSVELGDVIYYNGQYIFYGTAYLTDGRYVLWSGTGTDWDDINATTVVFDTRTIDLGPGVTVEAFQTPSVIKYHGTFIMQFTAGQLSSDAADERRLYSAYGGPFHFTPVYGEVLEVGAADTWEDRRVYTAQWLKEQDGEYLTPETVGGKIRLYYSGHTITGNPSENQGYTGLAEYTYIPFVGSMPSADNHKAISVDGTWTPTVAFGGASVDMTFSPERAGRYYRRGNMVFFDISLNWSAVGTSEGVITISLPLSVADGGVFNAEGGAYVGYAVNLNTYPTHAAIVQTNDSVYLYNNGTALTHAAIAFNSDLLICGWYITDAA